METYTYRVKAGQELAHEGAVLQGGARVELSPVLAAEFPHLVERIGLDGRPVPPPSTIEIELAKARPHERISILQAERVTVAEYLGRLDEEIAKETAANRTPTEAAAKATRPKPTPAAVPETPQTS